MTDLEPLAELAAQAVHDINGARPANPLRFFDAGGLLVQTLANEIRQRVSVGRLVMHRDGDANDALWHCDDGVWRPGAVKLIERACSQLLGERLRTAYVSNALLALRSGDLPLIDDGPPHERVIHFANGFLDWESLEFAEGHNCARRSTVRLAVSWDPDATCPEYDKWVRQILPDDCVDFIDEVTGYLLYNGNPLHKAILLYGTGRNGKGTFLRFVTALLGRENCASVPLQSLGENRFASAELHMKLANVAGDLDSRHVEATNVFKMVTGQDVIYAERKNGQPFRFTPWSVPIFSANKIPTSSDTSVGYLARWEVIPFLVDLTQLPHGPDDSIERYIVERELAGIARRGVLGLQKLMKRGRFDRPASVQEAFKEFEQRVDSVRAWLDERCDVGDASAWTYRTELHRDFDQWAARNEYKSLSSGTFYERLSSAGFRPKKSDNQRGYAGITLRFQEVAAAPPPVTLPSFLRGD